MIRFPVRVAWIAEDALGNRVEHEATYDTVEATLVAVRASMRKLNIPARYGKKRNV